MGCSTAGSCLAAQSHELAGLLCQWHVFQPGCFKEFFVIWVAQKFSSCRELPASQTPWFLLTSCPPFFKTYFFILFYDFQAAGFLFAFLFLDQMLFIRMCFSRNATRMCSISISVSPWHNHFLLGLFFSYYSSMKEGGQPRPGMFQGGVCETVTDLLSPKCSQNSLPKSELEPRFLSAGLAGSQLPTTNSLPSLDTYGGTQLKTKSPPNPETPPQRFKRKKTILLLNEH